MSKDKKVAAKGDAKQVNVQLDERLYARARKRMKRNGDSVRDVFTMALREYLRTA